MIALDREAPAIADARPRARPASTADRGDRLRVELFSDAVFAVAITVLVLELPLKSDAGSLVDALGTRWVSFAAFGISFTVIGCLWVSHWRLFHMLAHVDEVVALVNLALLLIVVLIPFGASTMATFVTRPGTQSSVAAAVFAVILLVMGLCFSALARVVERRSSARWFKAGWRARCMQMLGAAANAVAIGLAFVSPISVVIITGATAAYYLALEITGCRHLLHGAPDAERSAMGSA